MLSFSAFCRKVTNLQQMKVKRIWLGGKAKGGYEHMVGRLFLEMRYKNCEKIGKWCKSTLNWKNFIVKYLWLSLESLKN